MRGGSKAVSVVTKTHPRATPPIRSRKMPDVNARARRTAVWGLMRRAKKRGKEARGHTTSRWKKKGRLREERRCSLISNYKEKRQSSTICKESNLLLS